MSMFMSFRCLGRRGDSETSHGSTLGLVIIQVLANAVNQTHKLWRHSMAHTDGNHMDDLHFSVSSLP